MRSLRFTLVGLVSAALVATGAQSAQAASKYAVTLTLSTTTAEINGTVTLTARSPPRLVARRSRSIARTARLARGRRSPRPS
ncbi:hypothetical protein [Aeromicrobium sp. UC242_57]|uniref:hypothetical protein n=1 Tax=Aeromicrobium sp. UC242_57 TaxID=3374624 RepID=UPI00379DF605